jgi:hypothetical protein
MLRRWARSIEGYPCAFLLIHHDNRGGDYSGSSDINASISGCRLHLMRHPDKTKTNARIITQPKNRIAAEMPHQSFLLDIELQPRSHRDQIEGVKITPYEADELVLRKQRLDQAMTLALNTPEGTTYKAIWIAVGFTFDVTGLNSTDQEKWAWLKSDLEAQGFTVKLNGPKGGIVIKA